MKSESELLEGIRQCQQNMLDKKIKHETMKLEKMLNLLEKSYFKRVCLIFRSGSEHGLKLLSIAVMFIIGYLLSSYFSTIFRMPIDSMGNVTFTILGTVVGTSFFASIFHTMTTVNLLSQIEDQYNKLSLLYKQSDEV